MVGRPSKFNSQLTAKIAALYATGKTDEEVAKAIGVSVRTIYLWKHSQPDFLHALKESKAVADDLVETSLFRKATGYSHPEEKIFVSFGEVIRVKTIKHYAPDTTAAIFWLKNRRPEEWRESHTPPEVNPQSTQSYPQKKSFDDFCRDAKYPVPYPKQVEMKDFGLADTDPRLLLGARGYGKTDYVTVLGVAYQIYCDWFDFKYARGELSETNLIITKSKVRNTAIIDEIGMALKANGVELEKENSSCLRVKGLIGKDHSVEVLTIKSSFRGRHPKRILMDDPVTEEDTSEAMRTLVKKKYNEAYKLSKNIVIIGQPAHAFDLYAELRPQLKKLELPHGSIPELDADLNAMKLAGVDANSIMMSYHLKVPEEGSSVFANLKYIDKFPAGDSVAFIDPSDGGDYTALSIIKGYLDGVAVEGHAFKKAWYHCLDEILPILLARGVRKLCFETNKHGNQPIEQLQKLLAPHGIGVVGKFSDSNKHAAIVSTGSFSHLIHLSRESSKTYTDQVVKYEYNSKFDDSPDSLARGLEWIGLIRGKK